MSGGPVIVKPSEWIDHGGSPNHIPVSCIDGNQKSIETSFSILRIPFYHPILPLLCDSDIARGQQ
jgi:hypothetical protein